MPEAILVTLLPKMAMSAAIVLLTAFLVERTGALVGAMILTLPVTAGPAYLFLALEHGPEFLSQAAAASLSGTAANAVLVIVYAGLAQRHHVLRSIAPAVVGWALTITALASLSLPVAQSLLLNLFMFAAGIGVGHRLLSRQSLAPAMRLWWELPVRAAVVMLLIGAVLIAAEAIGPIGAGLATVAPVILISMPCILQPRFGGRAAADVMIHALWGMIGFVLAVATLSLTSVALGAYPALALALAVSVGWNLAVLAFRRALIRLR